MPQNKLVKAVTRLRKKLWSPKKKSKKRLSSSSPIWDDPPIPHPYSHLEPPPPPFPRRCSCSNSPTSYLPSAPPLPPWLEAEQALYAVPDPIVREEEEEEEATSSFIESYQQYMVPEPAYGVPVLPAAAGRERRGGGSGGFFGCLSQFGINAIRCFFPCFHVREARYAD